MGAASLTPWQAGAKRLQPRLARLTVADCRVADDATSFLPLIHTGIASHTALSPLFHLRIGALCLPDVAIAVFHVAAEVDQFARRLLTRQIGSHKWHAIDVLWIDRISEVLLLQCNL